MRQLAADGEAAGQWAWPAAAAALQHWESIFQIARCDARASQESSWQAPAMQAPSVHAEDSIGVRRIGIEGQSRLQFGGRAAAAAGAIILKPAGDFTPPFGLDGQVSFGRSGNSARQPTSARGRPKGRRRNSTYRTDRRSRRRNADRFLSPFRFALRMSRRTEVGSRAHSTSNAQPQKDLHRFVANWIPQAAPRASIAIYEFAEKSNALSFRAERGISLLLSPNLGEIPRSARNDKTVLFLSRSVTS